MSEVINLMDRKCPDTEHAKAVCKVGCGHETCRYLTMTRFGWSCEKLTSLALVLDRRADRGAMVARGDNCAGKASRAGDILRARYEAP